MTIQFEYGYALSLADGESTFYEDGASLDAAVLEALDGGFTAGQINISLERKVTETTFSSPQKKD